MTKMIIVSAVALFCANASYAQESKLAALDPSVRVSPRIMSLADVEAMTLNDDFAAYMKKDCPEPVRQAALQKLYKLMASQDLVLPSHY
jgi:hypothetical protein